MLTQERLTEYLDYDPVTGMFTTKERARAEFSTKALWQRCKNKAGRPVGCANHGGYVKIHIDGIYYSAHRLAWLWVYGEMPSYPEFEIDHINGDRADNRIVNLRKVTKSENQRNGARRRNNRSGVTGVNWVRSKRRWIARIWDGPHHRYLGAFKHLEDARLARERAEREIGYHKEHGRRKTLYVRVA